MKEKREIKGVKETNENYKGKVAEIVKKIIALALTLGIAISAAQAIKMYNEWKSSREQGTEMVGNQNKQEITFEDVKSLVEEYREAVKNDDGETINKLEEKLHTGNYFEVLFSEFEKELVETLGYDSEEVDVVAARDGVFLVDKQKASQKLMLSSNGTINPNVKYIDKNGKNPKIPTELKEMFKTLGEDITFADFRGMSSLEAHFSNLEYVQGYEIEEPER